MESKQAGEMEQKERDKRKMREEKEVVETTLV